MFEIFKSLLGKSRSELPVLSPVAPPAPFLEKSPDHPAPRQGMPITLTASVMPEIDVQITEAEVTAALEPFLFVLSKELPPLEPVHQWWNLDVPRKSLPGWLTPFVHVPIDQATLPSATQSDLRAAADMARELRARIRLQRKAKQPHTELLLALYGACVAADFVKALIFNYAQPRELAQYVDVRELGPIPDYSDIGYEHLDSLLKTDVKWLVSGKNTGTLCDPGLASSAYASPAGRVGVRGTFRHLVCVPRHARQLRQR